MHLPGKRNRARIEQRQRRCALIEPLEGRALLASVPAGFTETQLASNLTSPTALDIAPDGRVFFVDQSGHVRIIQNNQLLTTPFADLSAQTDGSGERGMLGVALDPNFASNRYVYVYYTNNSPSSHNRLSRLTADPTNPNVMLAGSELALIDFPNIGDAIWHMGGSLQFGPDGKIYISVGDHQQSANSQMLTSVFGKILRVNTDGTIPTDNPFYGQTTGINRAIWARGLRNPYSTAFQPGTGRFFINDVGEQTWEEINDGIAGANYGWPATEGDFNQASNPTFTRPFYTYQHLNGRIAITAGTFYNPTTAQFPSQYSGKYFFVDFGTGELRTIDPSTKALGNFATGLAFPDGMDVGSDGTLYYLARGAGAEGQPGIGTGRVYKIQYVAGIPPSISQHPQDKLVAVGQTATFTAAASGTAPLSYQWTRNGVDIAGATSTSYTTPGTTLNDNNTVFRVRVTNSITSVLSNPATLSVTTNATPVAIIDTPIVGTTYRGGDQISFSGRGTDQEDVTISTSAMTWWIDFHHDEHVHPFSPPTSGISGGTFTIPVIGEVDPDVFYRIHLVVTDSIGLQNEVYRDVIPIKANLTINSNVPGIQFTLDGQPHTAPLTIQGVTGLVRALALDPIQSIGGQWYLFTGWSDNGAEDHSISFPSVDTTLTANFTTYTGAVYLSDLPFAATPTNGWGPVERDRSNGEAGSADGLTITLNGVTYSKGLGAHASTSPDPLSRITFNLDGAYSRFLSDIGVDDEKSGSGPSILFQVFTDGVKAYDSGLMGATTATKSIDLDVSGVRTLELVVTDSGNGKGEDHGDWAGARLFLRPGPSAPVAHFEFDEGTGTAAADLSINANHGTLSGGTTWVQGLIAKNTISLNGTTGAVTIPNATQFNPTQAITIAAWINSTSWAGGDRRIVQKGNANNQYRLSEIGGLLEWSIFGIGAISAALPSAGTWHHVAGTYDGSWMKLLVDGVVVASSAATGAIPTTTDALTIGARNGSSAAGEHFNGAIDDVRVYARALNTQEVYDLAHPININFQLTGAPTPSSYLSDIGDIYGSRGNGQTYGWSSSHTDASRDRNINADQRLDTIVQMHNGQKWEIELPNGTYRVYVSVGDASTGSFTPTLNIEGFNAYTNLTLAANQYAFVSRIVTIADGRLTIDQGTDANLELRLNYIQIYSLNADVVAPTIVESPSQFIYDQPAAPGAAHGLQLNFSENISDLVPGDLQLTNLTTNTSVSTGWIALTSNANGGLFTFPGYANGNLPDGNYRVIVPAGSVLDSAGNRQTSAYTFDFFVLAGDANHDRRVDIRDLTAFMTNFMKPGEKTFSQGDFNYDETVDRADLSILARNWQKVLELPPPPPAQLSAFTKRPPTRSAVRPIDVVR